MKQDINGFAQLLNKNGIRNLKPCYNFLTRLLNKFKYQLFINHDNILSQRSFR